MSKHGTNPIYSGGDGWDGDFLFLISSGANLICIFYAGIIASFVSGRQLIIQLRRMGGVGAETLFAEKKSRDGR